VYSRSGGDCANAREKVGNHMLTTQPVFTGVMNPTKVDDNLLNRELYPYPPTSTTGGIVATPTQMRMGGGMGVLAQDTSNSIVVYPELHPMYAILLIAVVLWVFGR